MSVEPITSEVSTRICAHMNIDHKEALVLYARFYGGIDNVNQAKMIEINSQSMKLDVDGKFLEITLLIFIMLAGSCHT